VHARCFIPKEARTSSPCSALAAPRTRRRRRPRRGRPRHSLPRSPRPGPLPEPVPLLLCHCWELLQPACPGVAELQRCSHLLFCPYPYVLFVYLVDEISIFLVTTTIFHGCLIVHFGVHHERLAQFYLESLSLMYCTISVILVLYFVVLFMLL
jgi:hypothetical protein